MSSNTDPVVIVGMARTPVGGFLGELSGLSASDLGGHAIAGAIQRAGLSPEAVDEALMGCVLPAGQGQAPARQAARKGGLPDSVEAVTVNKMCGSGMKTLIQAHDSLLAGTKRIVVAGGMESMSNAPFLLPKTRKGWKYGPFTTEDHVALDGLEDAYQPRQPMGKFAEDCAELYGFDRNTQDAYALESLRRARAATEDGTFAGEIHPVEVVGRKETTLVDTDEQPGRASEEAIPHLRPAFKENGTVTPASSSSISDGAAALVATRLSIADDLGLRPLARIVSHAGHAQAPGWFTTAPVHAIRKLLQDIGWSASDVDLYEVNEAFAVVAMAAMHDLLIPHDRLNIHGGACALGHPIGASGARIVVTLLNAMQRRQVKRGVAGICIGGGEATAIALETLA